MMYKNIWIAFVDIEAKDGKNFNELIEIDEDNSEEYIGAWGNILIVSDVINNVPDIISLGLEELGMQIKFIDKIENVSSLIDYEEIEKDLIEEISWLSSSKYIFKINDKLFPYSEE